MSASTMEQVSTGYAKLNTCFFSEIINFKCMDTEAQLHSRQWSELLG